MPNASIMYDDQREVLRPGVALAKLSPPTAGRNSSALGNVQNAMAAPRTKSNRAETRRTAMAYRLSWSVQARRDEAPELPQHHRHGQADADVGGDLDPEEEALERVGEQELSAGDAVGVLDLANGWVSVLSTYG